MYVPIQKSMVVHVYSQDHHEAMVQFPRVQVSHEHRNNIQTLLIDESTFHSHPWEVMVEAAYRKYPNPYNPNVKSLDILERRISSPGKLFSRRLFCTMWCLPYIVVKVPLRKF